MGFGIDAAITEALFLIGLFLRVCIPYVAIFQTDSMAYFSLYSGVLASLL